MKIKLSVQHKQAVDALKKTEKEIEKVGDESKKTTGAMERMRIKTSGLRRSVGALRNNLLLVSFAFGGTVAAISKTVKLYGEQELAEKKLSTALGRSSQLLLDQASALQKVTTFGDESIITAQALIAAFTDDEATIKEATKATLDLAAAKGMDLVSKTLGSSTNALSRYGIEVTGAVGSTERLDSLTKNIAQTFGGQAAAQAETFSGKMSQMGNAAGDLGEQIGKLLVPGIEKVTEVLTDIITETSAFLDWADGLSSVKEAQELLNDETGEGVEIVADIVERYNLAGSSSESYLQTLLDLNDALVAADMNNQPYAESLKDMERLINNVAEANKIIINQMPLISEGTLRIADSEFEYKKVKNKTNQIDTADISNKERLKQWAVDYGRARRVMSQNELKDTARSAQSASQAMKQVVRSESMKAIAGLISSIFRSVPFPFNLLAAAGAGGLANSIITKGLDQVPNFATGADFVTNGPQMMMVGEGSGPERVQVTPLVDPNINGPQGSSVTVNISAPLVDETVVDHIIPAINEAVRRGEDIGIG